MTRTPEPLTPARARFVQVLAAFAAIVLIAGLAMQLWWTVVGMVCLLISLAPQLIASRATRRH